MGRGVEGEDIIKLNQSAGLNAKANELSGIKTRQCDADEFHKGTFAKMRARQGTVMGSFMIVTRRSIGQLLFQTMLQHGKYRIAAGDGGHAKIQQQVESCHETQRVANALG